MSTLKPKNGTWTIDLLSSFNVDGIIKEVNSFTDEWSIDTSRQDNSITHKDTEMYQLIYSDYFWRGGPLEINEINTLKTKTALNELESIYNFLENYFDGIVCRSEFVKMLPKSHVRKHVDGGYWLQQARRCHLPIVTNDNVLFTVEDNTINMKAGNLYEINNGIRHSVDNPTDFDRIHLIIDVMPKKMI